MSYVTHALCTHFQTFYKSIHNTVLQLGLNDNVVMKIVGDSVKCVCSRLSDTTYAFKLVYNRCICGIKLVQNQMKIKHIVKLVMLQ